MQTLISINELAGIKVSKRYQRILLGPETLIQADLTDLSDRVRLIFPISEMAYCELTRKGIMFFVKTTVKIPLHPKTREEGEVDNLFLSAFLNAIKMVNVHGLGPMPSGNAFVVGS